MNNTSNPISSNYKILLIEDDDYYARLVTIWLNDLDSFDCEVLHCQTLTQGKAAIQEFSYFDAILLDLSLPDSSGIETLTRLLAGQGQLNVIVLTGRLDKNWGIQALKEGAQDFLVKGEFDAEFLGRTLHYSIERNLVVKRLELTQQIAHIGSWECRPEDHFFKASEEFYRIFGRNFAQKITCDDILAIHSPLNLIVEIQEEARSKGDAQKDIWIKNAEGFDRYVAVFCRATYFNRGFGFYGILQDITERKQAQELREANELAKQTARLKEQFFANVSHEMRTPLNAILGISHLLSSSPLSNTQIQYVETIRQSSKVLMKIIGDLLQMSSLQNGQVQLSYTTFQLRQLIEQAHLVLLYKIKEKQLDFKCQIDPRIPAYFQGDALRLNQVLTNLLSNAIKFTHAGVITLCVHYQGETRGKAHLLFSISDTGIGIEPSFQERIFDPFVRVERSDQIYEGTGLGLPITKALVEQMGGQIRVESEAGKGSTFFIDLWLNRVDHSQLESHGTKQLETPEENMAFTILLVDDHNINRLVAQKILERKWPKAKVIPAADGEEAIHLLIEHPIDIILMDLQMPKQDGLSATRFIRTQLQPDKSLTPVLLMTANAQVTDNDEIMLNRQFDDYILKPFEPEQLYEKIKAHLKPMRAI
ncbi:MAG TPA: response regulator [Saprospiraceae bacterium]|nr:response regulator [Saprospiraceae bacterium]HMQ85906.1 response regulator [Saprospiraceae bacterium]